MDSAEKGMNKGDGDVAMLSTEASGSGLAPRLNVVQGAALIAGGMIGSGIFTNPGAIIALVGATGPALILWIIGSVLAFTAAMCYAEWGSRITQSGGDAPFFDHAFRRPPRFFAVIFSWTRVALINPGYNASLSLIAGQYFAAAFPDTFPSDPNVEYGEFYAKRIAVVLMVLQSLVILLSNNIAGRFLSISTALSVTCLVLFCGTGLITLFGVLPGKRNLESLSSDHLFAGTTSNPGAFAAAMFKVMWAQDGFANLASSLGELKDPKRNVGRASILGISVVAVLYLFANFTYLVSLPYDTIVTAGDALAAVWGEHMFGAAGRVIVSLLIFCCVLSCSLITMFSSSRIAHATGEAGLMLFPKFFKHLNSRVGTPDHAVLFNFVVTIVLMFAFQGETFWRIIDMVSYPLWFFYGLSSLGLLVVKARSGGIFHHDPTMQGVQVHAIGPMAVVAVSTFLMIFPFFQEGSVLTSALGWAVMTTGVVPWLVLVYLPSRRAKAAEATAGAARGETGAQ
ncbi:hypothetical protein GGF31_008678 [Allomyces arbusculus]|nr:hypothetical protein GGF31_008678 [Allomyces arbusculus]